MHNTELKFIVDHNVGKIAKWLRMVGFDAHLFAGADDAAMVAAALAENRILLTRDRRIMKRHVIVVGGIQAILIESDQFKAQVQQVISALRLNISSAWRINRLAMELVREVSRDFFLMDLPCRTLFSWLKKKA